MTIPRLFCLESLTLSSNSQSSKVKQFQMCLLTFEATLFLWFSDFHTIWSFHVEQHQAQLWHSSCFRFRLEPAYYHPLIWGLHFQLSQAFCCLSQNFVLKISEIKLTFVNFWLILFWSHRIAFWLAKMFGLFCLYWASFWPFSQKVHQMSSLTFIFLYSSHFRHTPLA